MGQKYGIDLTPNCTESDGDAHKQTKESFCQTVATENEDKYIQTDDGEIEREEFLNDARVDERSFQYHSKSMDFNHSYNNDSQSPDLFEDSFNDKVFANKLGDSITRKRRRTRSERSFKMSDDSDSDCIVVLDDEDTILLPIHHTEIHLPKIMSFFPANPLGVEVVTIPFLLTFLQMRTYSTCLRLLPLESKQPKKVSAKKQTRKKSDEHQKKCKRGKPRGRAKLDDNYFQFDSDEEDAMNPSLCSEGDSTTKPARKRATPPASQGTSTISRQSQSNPAQTPMLNYSLIDTPILKKELKRYGLKPLPRSKAKILLRHIYTETHK
ncbi:unnamed protein product [Allacma fusca]|uniref:Structure-specific endonuclease subunit SLX4 n=1 Tax=Allacma fusca TaxID=39272 RepID=A0A8J2L5Y1_9HEXA|nr:unnamed protein product [Allacma fusca]